MERKMYSKIAKTVVSSVALCGVAFSGSALADKVIYDSKKANKQNDSSSAYAYQKGSKAEQGDYGVHLAKGWKVSSTGGVSFINPHDDNYWFKVSGVIRLDETLYMGSYRDKAGNQLPNGANLRAADVYFDGGVGDKWTYSLQLQFGGGRFAFSDTYLSYSGLLENNQVFVGYNSGNWFGLDNSNSTSWNPFLERSLPSLAFYPGDGLGVLTDFWWENGAVTLISMQPGPGVNSLAQANSSRAAGTAAMSNDTTSPYGARDRWTGVVRGTVAPVHEEGDVWHFGMSGAWKELISTYNGVPVTSTDNGATSFGAYPSARTRTTSTLVNTGGIRANNIRLFNVEAARQYGPFMVQTEYTSAFVHRIGGNRGSVRFDGWNVQSRYLITGETHAYDVRDGAFGSVKPEHSYGAVEVAARYDFINLNDKDVRGGTEHDVTVGVNWFLNQQVRLSANYIRASIHPAADLSKRSLDIIGLRCQIRFK